MYEGDEKMDKMEFWDNSQDIARISLAIAALIVAPQATFAIALGQVVISSMNRSLKIVNVFRNKCDIYEKIKEEEKKVLKNSLKKTIDSFSENLLLEHLADLFNAYLISESSNLREYSKDQIDNLVGKILIDETVLNELSIQKTDLEQLYFVFCEFYKQELLESKYLSKYYDRKDIDDLLTRVTELESGHHLNPNLECKNKKITITMPPPPCDNFIGRKDFIEELHEYLINGNCVIIYAMGGMGKTEVARSYIKNYHDYFDDIGYVVWPDEKVTFEAFANELIRCTAIDTIDIPDRHNQYQAALRHLSRFQNTKSLLIIDNVPELLPDDKGEDLWRIIANDLKSLGFPILVCAREAYSQFTQKEVLPLSDGDCKRLFEIHWKNAIQEEDLIIWQKILERSGKHTLILELMGRTLELNGEALSWLLNQLEEKGFDLSSLKVQPLAFEKGINGTLGEHINMLFKMQKIRSEDEKVVLKNLCLFPAVKMDMYKWITWMNDERLLNAISNLVKRGWIRRQGKNIWMHPLVADAAMRELRPEWNDYKQMAEGLNKAMKIDFGLGDHPTKKRELFPFAFEILNRTYNDSLEYSYLCVQVAYYLFCCDRDREAAYWYDCALNIQENKLDGLSLTLAETYNKAALANRRINNLKKAKEYHTKALKILLEIDPIDKRVAEVYNDMGLLYKNQDKRKKKHETFEDAQKALFLFKKSLKINKKCISKDDPDVATTYYNIATVYQLSGDIKKALKYLCLSLDIRKKILGEDHYDMVGSYNLMGEIYLELFEYNKAIINFHKSLYIHLKYYPDEKLSTSSYQNLGIVYHKIYNFKLAKRYYHMDLKSKENTFGKKHEIVLNTVNRLKSFYYDYIYYIIINYLVTIKR